jgi:hypothetical protein
LAENAGLYLNRQTGRTLQIDVEEGTLGIRRGESFERLAPLSSDQYRLEEFPRIGFRFTRTAKGKRLEIREKQDDAKPSFLEEVDPWTPAPDELGAFEGEFLCPELDICDRVVLREGGLWLERRKYGANPLHPTTTDRFTTEVSSSLGAPFPYDIAFRRDAGKRITGFEVNAGRVRHLKYVRKDCPERP